MLPFIFVYSPGLLMQGPWHGIIAATAVTTLAVIVLSVGVEGYFLRRLTGWERAAAVLAAFAGMTLSAPGVLVFAAVSLLILVRARRRT